jgi:hypothetical protein
MIDEWKYFESLTRKPLKLQLVKCLKCKKMFRGTISKRICASCTNDRGGLNHYVVP